MGRICITIASGWVARYDLVGCDVCMWGGIALPALLSTHIQTIPLIVGLPLVFLGGLLSFVSPCVLPLVPGYLGYLAGTSVGTRTGTARRALLVNGFAFVLGFSAVFTVAGIAVGQLLTNVQAAQGYVRWIGGIVVILLGFHTLGVIRIPLLMRTVRVQIAVSSQQLAAEGSEFGVRSSERESSNHNLRTQDSALRTQHSALALARSFLVGIFFAAGWSPCVGPILAGIYGVIGARPASGGLLLFVYSLGLGVPFLAVALLFGQAAGVLRRVNRYYGVIAVVSGIFLIGIGLLLLTDAMARLARYAPAINLPGVS